MTYKLIASDVDGTLLNNDDIITERTKTAIIKCIKKGVVFTISTGRPLQGLKKINNDLDLDFPFITYNGAMVVMGKSKEVLYEKKLSATNATEVIKLGEKFDTTMIVWADNILYANCLNERTKDYSKIAGIMPVKTDLHKICKNGVSKVLWYDDVPRINSLLYEVKELLPKDINIHTSKPYFLEFVDKDASKAIALEKIGEKLGIKRDEIIAVGDGLNDISMVEYAGLGVAMGNAHENLKSKADYITCTNDMDGLAHVIEKFILCEN